MALNNFVEYNLSLEFINDKRISEKIKSLIKTKIDIVSLSIAPAFTGIAGIETLNTDISINAKLNFNTYFEVKMLECAMALENGADEIEILLISGEIIDKEFDKIIGELEILKSEFEPETIMKVDIHFNKLSSQEIIKEIIHTVSKAGADFIVLNLDSLSNNQYLSTALEEIKIQSLKHSRQIGVKFKNIDDDEFVLKQVDNILGAAWNTSELLRIERDVL